MTSIAILTPSLTSAGGVERYCELLASALSTRGVHACLFTPREAVPRADAVITNGMRGVRTRLPRIHVFHGCWVQHMRTESWGGALTDARITVTGAVREAWAGNGAVRVAVSRSTAAEIRSAYHLSIQHVIPNPVDTTVFGPTTPAWSRQDLGLPANVPLALFVGRDEPGKRFALARSVAAEAGYLLATVGAHQLGDVPLGVVTPVELARVLRAVDVLLAPSAYEASSLVVLESLSVGTPVVGTRVGWVPELLQRVPEYRALTADVDDLQGLMQALQSIGPGSGPALHAATALVRAEHNLDAFADAWANVVASVLQA